jgi:YesN/AraC family two-component response regulator
MDLSNNIPPTNTEHTQSVLVVEDNDELREFLVTFLSMEYLVYSADNGQSGIKLAIERSPDMIISDVLMPIKDGFELVSQLSQNKQTCHIPIILITAKIDKESQHKGLSLGAVDYITKPFDIKNISFKLKNILMRQRKLLSSHLTKDNQDDDKVQHNEPDKLFLKKLDHIIANSYQDSNFSVAKLISEIGITERQLQRKFKRLYNEKPATYIKNYRLNKAKELLLKGQSIAITSDNVGFNSQSYFSQSFKEAFGKSPKDFTLKNSLF